MDVRTMSDARLQGQTALVTGASQGLGKVIATRFAQEGARVVLAARSRERLQETAAEIEAAGGSDALSDRLTRSTRAPNGVWPSSATAVVGTSRGRPPRGVPRSCPTPCHWGRTSRRCSTAARSRSRPSRARVGCCSAPAARREECLTYRCQCTFTDGFQAPFPVDRVRLTSIYSRGDGVVRWQAQLVP